MWFVTASSCPLRSQPWRLQHAQSAELERPLRQDKIILPSKQRHISLSWPTQASGVRTLKESANILSLSIINQHSDIKIGPATTWFTTTEPTAWWTDGGKTALIKSYKPAETQGRKQEVLGWTWHKLSSQSRSGNSCSREQVLLCHYAC